MDGKISLTFTMKYMYQEVVNAKEISKQIISNQFKLR